MQIDVVKGKILSFEIQLMVENVIYLREWTMSDRLGGMVTDGMEQELFTEICVY